ncbi:MAG: hypothetical protein HRT89_02165 [Lentisphaeria bacterium]|nr:hypothetical protein [Lentisphaeria bacterium]NQZ66852.1 hypothetical protein [Lentisphaeria bacterium]
MKYPCGQCGASLVFNPGTANLKCEYCGFENIIPQSEEDIKELDFEGHIAKLESREESTEDITVKCGVCGAEATFDSSISSDECPYCASPLSTEKKSKKQIKPKSLLPFKIEMSEADDLHLKWIDSLWFAPNNLKKRARLNGIHGMYMPFWTFDSFTVTFYTGERGEDYWTTETYTTTDSKGNSVTRTRQVRKTRWHRCSGTVYNNFDDILIPASTSLPYKLLKELEPWDLGNLTEHNTDYLTGFRTESYQLGVVDGFENAKDDMQDPIRDKIRWDIGGDHQRIHSTNTDYQNLTFKHILLPVWISPYRYNEKLYRTMINARTGEVQGERPWSWVKITLAVLAALILIIGVIVLIFMGSSNENYGELLELTTTVL